MLASVVIDRTYSRQFLPKSSSPRTLCLSVEFSDSFHPTSVVPTAYALLLATAVPQPLCNQSVTHSFYLDGGMPAMALPHDSDPLDCLFFSPYLLYFQYLENSFAFFCITQKINSFIFKRFRTLCEKNGGWGGWGSQRSASSWKFSMVKVGNSLRSTTRQSRVTSHESPSSDSGEPKST